MNKKGYCQRVMQEVDKLDNLKDKIDLLKLRLLEYNNMTQLEKMKSDIFQDDGRILQNQIDYYQDILTSNPEVQVKPITPIWWKDSLRLLGYMVEELEKQGLIDVGGELNKLIKDHFIDKNKNPFTDSIKQNRSGTVNNKGTTKNTERKPKGHQKVESILDEMNKIRDKKSK